MDKGFKISALQGKRYCDSLETKLACERLWTAFEGKKTKQLPRLDGYLKLYYSSNLCQTGINRNILKIELWILKLEVGSLTIFWILELRKRCFVPWKLQDFILLLINFISCETNLKFFLHYETVWNGDEIHKKSNFSHELFHSKW